MAQVPSSTSKTPAATNATIHPPLASLGQTESALPRAGLDLAVEIDWSAVGFLAQLHNRFLAHKISINYEKSVSYTHLTLPTNREV